MGKEHLEYVLVPLGLSVFLIYHVWLLYTILRNPLRTVIGLNAESRHQWVLFMMNVSASASIHFTLHHQSSSLIDYYCATLSHLFLFSFFQLMPTKSLYFVYLVRIFWFPKSCMLLWNNFIQRTAKKEIEREVVGGLGLRFLMSLVGGSLICIFFFLCDSLAVHC